jgi:hypothetical protein
MVIVRKFSSRGIYSLFILLFLVNYIGVSSAVNWNSFMDIEYFGEEDSLPFAFIHNFSADTINRDSNTRYYIDSINMIDSSLHGIQNISFFNWIFWEDTLSKENSSTGILIFNSTNENHTGSFKFTLRIGSSDAIKSINVTINASNDAPIFLNLHNVSNPYKFNVNTTLFIDYSIPLIIGDEEGHFPINITNFYPLSCSKANWTDRENCNLNFSFNYLNESKIYINFSNISLDHIGVYNFSICINDTFNPSLVPFFHSFNYNESKQSCKNLSIDIFYYLNLNASNCSNLSLKEGQNLNCYIDIYTKLPQQEFFLNSFSSLTNSFFIGSLIGSNWFYPLRANTSSNNFLRIPIFLENLSKRNVGLWEINLSLNNSLEFYSTNITLFINNTNSKPTLYFNFSGDNNSTSLNAPTLFNVSIHDEDFLIPDKNLFNETINLSIRIFNQSDISKEVFWQNFTHKSFYYSSGNSSILNQNIHFTPNSSQTGDWVINFTYFDTEGLGNTTLFNFTILDNEYPYWNKNFISLSCVVNSTIQNTSSCLNINLTNYTQNFLWANDSDIPPSGLTFFILGAAPPSFNLTTDGLINFTPWKKDVSTYLPEGVWRFNISVRDSFLRNDSLQLVLNISHINSIPEIKNIVYSPIIYETSTYSFSFEIWDEDFMIPNINSSNELNYGPQLTPIYYNSQIPFESSLSLIGRVEIEPNYYSTHLISLNPNKSNIGNYTLNLSIKDHKNGLNWTLFNISVIEINNPPFFEIGLINHTLSIWDSFIYMVYANDTEDWGNLTYNYFLLDGFFQGRQLKQSRIFDDSSFNSSSGKFNLTLNSSHAGAYHINLTVQDNGLNTNTSLNKTSWADFWLFIYDSPNISYPQNLQNLSLVENQTSIFNFAANHSIGDNLYYEVWMDNIHSCTFADNSNCIYSNLSFVDSFIGLGNSTNLSWNFTPNFNQETYGLYSNLKLFVYPANNLLLQKHILNSSLDLKINISHKNHPLTLNSNISSPSPSSNTGEIKINLSQFFIDHDSTDPFYLQKINFTIQSDQGGETLFNFSESDNILTIRLKPSVFGKISRTENLNVTAYEINSSTNNIIRTITSNNFQVIFIEPTISQVNTPSYGGGSTTITKHSSILITVPSTIQAGFGDNLQIPLSIFNNGEVSLSGISLKGEIRLENKSIDDVEISLSKSSISVLPIGAKEDTTAFLNINTRQPGRYLGIIYADISSPKFKQEAQFYIEIEVIPSRNIEEILIFTEKLVVGNPECIELKARLLEVDKLRSEGRLHEALKLSEDVLDSCKNSISQKRSFNIISESLSRPLIYLLVSLICAIIFIFIFYVYKRIKFNKVNYNEYL